MEQGPLLPSIQVCPSNGPEVSYKVQYAPVYTGRAKSRPLSAYEEGIIKKALFGCSHDASATKTEETNSIDIAHFDSGSYATSSAIAVDTARRPTEHAGNVLKVEATNVQMVAGTLLTRRTQQPHRNAFTKENEQASSINLVNESIADMNHRVSAATSHRPVNHGDANGIGNSMKTEYSDGLKAELGSSMSEDIVKLKLHNLKKLVNNRKKAHKADSGLSKFGVVPNQAQIPNSQFAEQRKVGAAKDQVAELKRYQRRIIYMLNRIMTEAEGKQFDNFVKLNGMRPKEYPRK